MLYDEIINPNRALAIVAHPDDIEYYCGGTLAKWIINGCCVDYLVTTSGEKGSHDVNANIEDLINLREKEQKKSADILGVNKVSYLRYSDSEINFVDHNKLRGEYVKHIRQSRPDVILTHDPYTRLTRQHPDHRIVGQLAMDASFPLSAVAQCYIDHIIKDGLQPFQPSYLFQFGTDQPNYWVEISQTLKIKILALQQHVSQVDAFDGGIENRLKWKANTIGKKVDLEAAEEYLVVKVGPTLPECNAL